MFILPGLWHDPAWSISLSALDVARNEMTRLERRERGVAGRDGGEDEEGRGGWRWR